jgi:hypothetical protein
MPESRRSIWIVVGVCVVGAGLVVALATRPQPKHTELAPGGAAPAAGLPPPEAARRRLAQAATALPMPVPTDPLAPGYSPDKLVKVAGLDVIYEAEPRRDVWATAVENALGGPLQDQARALVPQLNEVKLDCRTTMCAVRWTFRQPLSQSGKARFREVMRQLFPGSGRFTTDARLVYWAAPEWNGDVRQTDAFIAAAMAHLAKASQFLRSPEGERRLAEAVADKR